ncbi:cache domain-containing sensor histidine kinase [Paenibacillus glycanilyticus]|uniref:cache domain-containing sensor histidine kinase n=1 Tax=Paenibacillus glycanilyticus TaxID=126569 RepID=UPI003EBAD152
MGKEARAAMTRLTYYRRIQLSFLLFIIFPILAVSVISYTLLKQNMIEKFQISNNSMLNVIVGEIDRTIDDVTFASHYIVNDSELRASLNLFADTSRLNTYTDYTRFIRIKDSFSLITSKPLNNSIHMYLVNRANFILSPDSENLAAINSKLAPLLKNVNASKPVVLQYLGLLHDNADDDGTYYLARVIGDGGGKPYTAVLLVGIEGSYFEKLLERVEFGQIALFDGTGKRIAGSPDVRLQSDDSSDSVYRNQLTLDKTDWKLAYETSEDSLFGQISRAFYIGIGLVLVFTLVFSVISLLFARKLHNPIQKLQRVARQFALGNRDMRLEVKGRDDIAELGHSFNQMLDEIEVLITNIEQEQEQKRVMELEALFMQIRPHFLINTLNSIKCSLILSKDQVHSGIVDSLMNLLRAYLKVNTPSSLEEECRLLGYYVDIMKVRSEMPLSIEVRIEPELKSFVVPKLVLQPIVENAIVHGLDEKDELHIVVHAYREQGRIYIAIEDDGGGMEEEQLVWLNRQLNASSDLELDPDAEDYVPYERVGLRNVIQRLKLTYGSAEMKLIANAAGGITVILSIPIPSPIPAGKEVSHV